MTLREKFYTYSDNEYSEKLANAENCEKIADDFAIGFAEWCLDENHIIYNDGKELLEIY